MTGSTNPSHAHKGCSVWRRLRSLSSHRVINDLTQHKSPSPRIATQTTHPLDGSFVTALLPLSLVLDPPDQGFGLATDAHHVVQPRRRTASIRSLRNQPSTPKPAPVGDQLAGQLATDSRAGANTPI